MRSNLDISFVKESAVICQLPFKMADEVNIENGRISSFQRHVTLTLDRAIWHTVVHHSSTSIHSNRRNFLLRDGRTDVLRTYGRKTLRPALLGQPRSCIVCNYDMQIQMFPFPARVTDLCAAEYTQITKNCHIITVNN